MHFDLTRIIHLVLNAFDDVVRHHGDYVVVHNIGFNHDADLAARLHGKGLINALKTVGDVLELFKPLDVGLDILAARARSRGRNRVGCGDQHRDDAGRLHVAVVGFDRVDHDLVLAVFSGQLRADGHMGALGLVVNGFADVMEQSRAARHDRIDADFGGHESGNKRDFGGMFKGILPVACAVAQTTEHFDQIGVDAVDADRERGAFAGFFDRGFNLIAGLFDDLLDTGRMDAPVADELFKRLPCDLAAYRVEG